MKLDEIKDLLLRVEVELPQEIKEIWDDIKIEPEMWSQVSQIEKNGFWVVGQIEKEVIWYNHLISGFNISKFRKEGQIEEYWDEGYDLPQLLWHLF